MREQEKPVEFLGSALKDLRAFPIQARQEMGYQLALVQQGRDPDDWKPMVGIGAGVCEIRVAEAGGAFRLIYVARFSEVIYVLHAFQKKTQQTAKRDIDIANVRYRKLLRDRKP